MSASCADALLTYVMSTVEAKRTVEEEATEIERAHDSLLEERLEKGHEWLEELERRGALLEQREDEQDSDCPPRNCGGTTTRAKYTITNQEETQRSRVAPTHCSRGRTVFYRKGWEQVIESEFEGHIKTGTFSMVDRVPEGRKPESSKWCFDYKREKKGNSCKSVKWITPAHLLPVHHQHPLSWYSQ